MSCPVTDSLVRWVLQMGESVVVLEPEELRKEVVARARNLLANQERVAG
jgi:predicted DNA-binding transcriptional regulator YafY